MNCGTVKLFRVQVDSKANKTSIHSKLLRNIPNHISYVSLKTPVKKRSMYHINREKSRAPAKPYSLFRPCAIKIKVESPVRAATVVVEMVKSSWESISVVNPNNMFRLKILKIARPDDQKFSPVKATKKMDRSVMCSKSLSTKPKNRFRLFIIDEKMPFSNF